MTIWPWELSFDSLGTLVAASLIKHFPQGLRLKAQLMRSITYMLTGHQAKTDSGYLVSLYTIFFWFLQNRRSGEKGSVVCYKFQRPRGLGTHPVTEQNLHTLKSVPALYGELRLGSRSRTLVPQKLLALPRSGPQVLWILIILSKILYCLTQNWFSLPSQNHVY